MNIPSTRRRVLFVFSLGLVLLLGAATARAQSTDAVRAERVHSHETHGEVQRAAITVTPRKYAPSAVVLAAGIPAELVFTRPEAGGCGDEVHVPDLGVEKTALPVGEAVTIRFTPAEPGTYEFLCGMNMLRGELIVE